jgi:hydrogenase 3 maturation protease
MECLDKILIERLRKVEKLSIVGAGLFLSSDNAAGLIVTENLKKRFPENAFCSLKILLGEKPESFADEIIQFKPEHLIVIDTADALQEPGSLTVIKPDIMTGVSYFNHMLEVRVLVEYVKKEAGCGITILGIQPADVSYGKKVTEKVSQSIKIISDAIENVIVTLGLAE